MAPVRTDSGTLMCLAIDELLILILALRLQTYLTTLRLVWRDIVDAADWHVAMGRECAAVAVALVSARSAD